MSSVTVMHDKLTLSHQYIHDIITKVTPLHLMHQISSYEPNLTLLAPVSTKLSHLSLLFILDVHVCTVQCHLKIKTHTITSQLNLTKFLWELWNHVYMITFGGPNSMRPVVWQYLKCWWNDVILLSTSMSADKLYRLSIFNLIDKHHTRQEGYIMGYVYWLGTTAMMSP